MSSTTTFLEVNLPENYSQTLAPAKNSVVTTKKYHRVIKFSELPQETHASVKDAIAEYKTASNDYEVDITRGLIIDPEVKEIVKNNHNQYLSYIPARLTTYIIKKDYLVMDPPGKDPNRKDHYSQAKDNENNIIYSQKQSAGMLYDMNSNAYMTLNATLEIIIVCKKDAHGKLIPDENSLKITIESENPTHYKLLENLLRGDNDIEKQISRFFVEEKKLEQTKLQEQQEIQEQQEQDKLYQEYNKHIDAYIDHVANGDYSKEDKEKKLEIAREAKAILNGTGHISYPIENGTATIYNGMTNSENSCRSRNNAFCICIAQNKDTLQEKLNSIGIQTFKRLFNAVAATARNAVSSLFQKEKNNAPSPLSFFRRDIKGEQLVNMAERRLAPRSA